MDTARCLWQRLETLHAVTYFGHETVQAGDALGLPGWWATYFATRAAPLGAVGPGVVDATFYNFAPSFVRRWVPAVWEVAAPAVVLPVRSSAAAATLRRSVPDIEDVAVAVASRLATAIDSGRRSGKALYAANRDLALPEDPVEALWQQCTTFREHRGDVHNAALVARGVDGVEAHVLIAADRTNDASTTPEDLQRTRGLTSDDWAVAEEHCQTRGLLDASGALTDAGRALRRDIESTTDQQASELLQRFSAGELDRLLDELTPPATTLARAGIIRFPNPIGLPPL